MKHRSPHRLARRSVPQRSGSAARLQTSPQQLARALAACSLLTFWPGAAELRAQVLPSGMNTVAGQVTARTVAGTLTVNNSPNAIINWNSFSIGASNAVRFEQAGASSQVLNRVVGNDPSAILGSLSSNGRVWLLNPNGVLFGQGARVDVAGLVTSTLNLNNADWLAGNHRFVQGAGSPAGIVNQGELRSSFGGQIALIGATVRNEGEINAPGGQVVLAAGSSVELIDSATPNVSVKLNSGAGEVLNLGSLMAAGGRIDVQAATVNQNGIVRADSLSTGPGGEVVLQATDRLSLAGASQTSAVSASGQGGKIQLLGREVGLLDTARVDVSGASGGGEVLVGGGLQGKDPSVPNAQAVYFGRGASILADATSSGDGGRIILWSDKATRAFGSLSVHGGPFGGDGGFIETSGGWLDARPAMVDTSAPQGHSGTWLLDPYDLTISDSGTEGGFDASFTANASPALILTSTLNAALDAGTQVVVSTGTGDQNVGPSTGNITLSSANILTTPSQPGGSLTLIADGYISMLNSVIEASGSFSVPVTLRAGRGGEGKGSIFITNSSILSNGGDIDLGGFASYPSVNGGTLTNAASTLVENRYSIDLQNATLDAGAGAIRIRGGNLFAAAGNVAVLVSAGLLTGRSIDIEGSAASDSTGVQIASGRLSATEGIALTGYGGSRGIDILGDSRFTVSPSASISAPAIHLTGTSLQGIGTAIDGSALTDTLFSVLPTTSGVSTDGIVIEGTAGSASSPGVRIFGDGNGSVSGTSLLIDLSQTNDPLLLGTPGSAVQISASMIKMGGGALTVQSGGSTDLDSVDISTGGQVNLLSSGDVSLLSTSIQSNDVNTKTPVYLSAGDGSLTPNQRVGIEDSTIITNGGEIFAGGPVSFNPTPGGPNGYSAASGDNGVLVVNSTLNAGSGNVFLFGKSMAGAGTGVSVQAANLFGQNVIVEGEATGAGNDGVHILSGSQLLSPFFVVAVGKGTQFGVVVDGGSTLDVAPNSFDPGALLRIVGESTGSNYGAYIHRPGGSGPSTLVTQNGAALEVSGFNAGGGPSLGIFGTADELFPVIDGSTGGSISLIANKDPINFNTQVSAGEARIEDAVILGSTSGLLLQAPTDLYVADSTISTSGPINVYSDNVTLDPNSVIESLANGNIVLAGGVGRSNMLGFNNNAGASALSAGSNQSWFVYATDPADGTNFVAGSLAYDFQQYGATYPAAPQTGASGNGFLFSKQQTATVTSGTPIAKYYDGSSSASINPAITTVTPSLSGDSGQVSASATFDFASKNAGLSQDIAVTAGIGQPEALTMTDAQGKPVYGYTLVSQLKGDILAKQLDLNGTRSYDGTLGVDASVLSLSGLVGSETLTLSGTGTMADKNVGIGKALSLGTLALGDGLNGGLASNYSFVGGESAAIRTVDITPAALILGTANVTKVYDGTLFAPGSATVIGGTLYSGDSLTGGSLAFTDKNVGSGNKTVTVSGVTVNDGNDGGNYNVSFADNTTSSITPLSLSVTGLSVSNKIYDATTAATLAGTGAISALGNDVVALTGTALASFSDKNVGIGKSVLVSGLSLSGIDSGNYQLAGTLTTTADITPATLAITGLIANDKVYDATRTATLGGTARVSALGNDAVNVGGTPLALFSDKNVGLDKTVTVSGYTLSGADAGNYTVVQPGGLSADITPATLRYVATPVTQSVGLPLPPLTGSVDGFVGGETLQLATTGTLAFTSPVTDTSVAGPYTIIGGGLSATNYVFVQDAANATALTLSPSSSPSQSPTPTTPEVIVTGKIIDAAPKQALKLMARSTPPADPGLGGVIDLVPGVSTAATPAAPAATTPARTAAVIAPVSFEPVRLSDMSSEALVGMLDARTEYKRALFADALADLEKDPTLADMPPCQSREELLAGGCVVTEALKRKLKSMPAPAVVAIAPPVTAAATPPAPAATPAVPAAPVVTPAPVVAAVAPPAPLLASGARRVRSASLPQIHRKVALVIGIDRYEDPTIPTLGNAVGDARAIGKVLESQMGYETVVLENATKKSVVAALNLLAVELDPKDSVTFYYAGHGELVESTKLGYWLLADADAKRPETWLSNADIGRMIAQVDASQVALISDSCYSGSLVTDQRIRAAAGTVDPAQLLSRKSVVVMSSGGNEPVADAGKQGHSPFAWNLMNNFRQLSAWQPGGNVFERVRFAVAKELPQRPQYGAFVAGGYQGGDYLFEQRQLEPGAQ